MVSGLGEASINALDALWVGIMRKKVNWMLDADVRSFFDNLSHEWLVKFIEHRIADRRVLRLIREMAEGGSVRGREVVEDGSRDSTREQ
jgi:RNA-directed DNA polymerase